MNKEIFAALSALEKENHIDKEILIDKIKQGIMKAIKRDYPMSEHITVDIDPENNKFEMKLHKLISYILLILLLLQSVKKDSYSFAQIQ